MMKIFTDSQANIILLSTQLQTASSQITILFLDEKTQAEESEVQHGGSVKGKRPNLNHNFEEGYCRLYHNYFSDSPVYPLNNSGFTPQLNQ